MGGNEFEALEAFIVVREPDPALDLSQEVNFAESVLPVPSLSPQVEAEEGVELAGQASIEVALTAEYKRMAREAKDLIKAMNATEQKREAEAVQKREVAEISLQEMLDLEQTARDFKEKELRNKLLAAYIESIIAKVRHNWIRPPGNYHDLACRIRVEQVEGGEVIRTEIIESSGVRAFDRAVIAAISKSSPLPQPQDPSLFAPVLTLKFIP